MGLRVAKVNKHAVTYESGDVATRFANYFRDPRLVRTEKFLHFFWIKSRGESGGTDEVAEHYGELPPFGTVRNPLAILVDRSRGGELSDGIYDFPPVTDCQDSNFF
jgi:hypothetical protein